MDFRENKNGYWWGRIFIPHCQASQFMGKVRKSKVIFIFAIFFAQSWILGVMASYPSEPIWISCEVIEVSKDISSPSRDIPNIYYAIIHHKFQEDRQRLSLWLKRNSGKEVKFQTSDGKEFNAVLNRLKMCFGRGLLIYFENVPLKEKDVIKILLSQ
jgi:hypothetical protein